MPRTRASNHEPPTRQRTAVAFGPISDGNGHRIVLFGPGGIGKTTLAATAPGPVAFFDLDDSLPRLKQQLADAPAKLDLRPVSGIRTWQNIRDALHADGWDGIRTIVIDSATRAEELAVEHTLASVPHEKGQRVQRIEDYGFGKGYSHVYDTFLTLLGDLDQHTRAGLHVILICHDCTASVPNPDGEDWIRYEPRLQSPASGKSSIRLRVREWADHVLFVGYDVAVKDGKGSGSGSRTIYPNELPHCMAKSRTLSQPLPLSKFDSTLWTNLLGDNHVA
ncbi:ATP-binding protein [Fontivita pretiosa]|uniref:ATP-binding protein n=1 Tax=Fontivita pretiosa TaxID=2989684 RepID=UPI003D1816EA